MFQRDPAGGLGSRPSRRSRALDFVRIGSQEQRLVCLGAEKRVFLGDATGLFGMKAFIVLSIS